MELISVDPWTLIAHCTPEDNRKEVCEYMGQYNIDPEIVKAILLKFNELEPTLPIEIDAFFHYDGDSFRIRMIFPEVPDGQPLDFHRACEVRDIVQEWYWETYPDCNDVSISVNWN